MVEADVFLSGKNTVLRSLTSSDFSEQMVRWTNDREVTKFLSRGTFPGCLEKFKSEFELLCTSQSEIQLAVVARKSGAYIGVTGLHSINWVSRHAEFRILIGEKEYWGQGLGTEACQLMVAYAFEVLNLNKVWLGVNSANTRAHQSYLKAGFFLEGELRAELYRNGKFFNIVRMSILRNEYEAVKGKWPIATELQKQLST